jgi:hypothetical protein
MKHATMTQAAQATAPVARDLFGSNVDSSPQPCSDTTPESPLLARLGTRFGAAEVARTLAWLAVQFYPAKRTKAEVLTKLRTFEAAVTAARQAFEAEA